MIEQESSSFLCEKCYPYKCTCDSIEPMILEIFIEPPVDKVPSEIISIDDVGDEEEIN